MRFVRPGAIFRATREVAEACPPLGRRKGDMTGRQALRLTLTTMAAAFAACLVVLAAPPEKAGAAFPGVNGRIAYDGPGGIWTARPDGTDARLVIPEGPARESATAPVFSPDGRRIAFQANPVRDGQSRARDIFVANADGTGVVALTDAPGDDAQPTFSPDGGRVAFVSDRDREPEEPPVDEVYVVDVDGTDAERVTRDLANASSPAWSPNGGRIAFVSDRGGVFDIWTISPDGANPRNLTNSPRRADFQPSWSPDGKKITFDTTQFAGDVWVMNSDGTGQRNLTPTPYVGEYEPSFSPDGRSIAFTRSPRNGRVQSDIWKMRASDGLARVRVTDDPNPEGFPDWGPRPETVR